MCITTDNLLFFLAYLDLHLRALDGIIPIGPRSWDMQLLDSLGQPALAIFMKQRRQEQKALCLEYYLWSRYCSIGFTTL